MDKQIANLQLSVFVSFCELRFANRSPSRNAQLPLLRKVKRLAKESLNWNDEGIIELE